MPTAAIVRSALRLFALPVPQFLAVVVPMYLLAWLLSFVAGGASFLPPHAFYVPIAIVGIRFGVRGAVAAGVIAAVLAGPALPADVASWTPQHRSEWVSRGVFFVVASGVVTHLVHATVHAVTKVAKRKAELVHAVEANQLLVMYQPLVQLNTGLVVGAEALVRWEHPTRGLVGPQEFVPFAEEHGLIDAVGDWVLHQAVADMHEWAAIVEDEPFPIRELAINVSRCQLSWRSSLLEALDAEIGDRPLPVKLIVEVTETALAEDPVLLPEFLMDLKLRGLEVAIDDFGTGQSSVVAVRDLPIDIIKIDKTFVDGLTTDSSDRHIVENTVALAARLGKRTIGEGVETREQLDALVALGVDQAQGYFLGRPMPIDQLRAWVVGQETRPVIPIRETRLDRKLTGPT